MSRIGRKPIVIPSEVSIQLSEGNILQVKGPKGTLTDTFHKNMTIIIENNVILVERKSEDKFDKALHGLTRTLISNMVEGVTKGYEKTLEINGVGYRALKTGNKLVLNIGYSHPVELIEPSEITVEVPTQTKIIVKGINKQAVGEFAAIIRSKREPEPYKGKGIKYINEVIRRKEGKTGGKGKK